jgi:ABC-type ATPase with predicted acetyltransferase domain
LALEKLSLGRSEFFIFEILGRNEFEQGIAEKVRIDTIVESLHSNSFK